MKQLDFDDEIEGCKHKLNKNALALIETFQQVRRSFSRAIKSTQKATSSMKNLEGKNVRPLRKKYRR